MPCDGGSREGRSEHADLSSASEPAMETAEHVVPAPAPVPDQARVSALCGRAGLFSPCVTHVREVVVFTSPSQISDVGSCGKFMAHFICGLVACTPKVDLH